MPRLFNCPKCSRRTFTIIKLIQHIGLIHAHEANFSITCGLNDCQRSFTKYASFRCHVYRKHKNTVLQQTTTTTTDPLPLLEEVEKECTTNVAFSAPPNMNELLQQFRENLFAFTLKCREKNHLPQSVQQEILDDVNFLFSFFKENYDEFLAYHLEKNGFDLAACPELQEVLQSPDFFSEASRLVRSPHMLKEFCKEKFEMTEPIQYTLRDPSGNKTGSYSYVPICEVLRKYCSHEDIWDQIQAELNIEKDELVLNDYRDGLHFKNHKIFAGNPQALRLHFYEDEFEVCNPLGSKRNKHKLFAIYYTVGNVGTKYCSQLKHMHLALLVRYCHVKQFGLDEILKPLIDDLKKLSSEGINVLVDGSEKNVCAAVAVISADNLSSHLIGGFSMSFNVGRICRYCMATHGDIKRCFNESDFVLRTADVHRYHLECVKENPDTKAIYGVT